MRRITPPTDDQLMTTVEARVLRAHAHFDDAWSAPGTAWTIELDALFICK